MRLRSTMVLHMARESPRQGRRDDVKEANDLHDAYGASRVLRAEYSAREDGLHRQKCR